MCLVLCLVIALAGRWKDYAISSVDTLDIAYQRQVAKATRHHQKTPFTTKKEISAGGNSKNKAKGFSGGASAGVPAQALGLSLHGSAAITLEMGSRFFVERSHRNSS